MARPITEDSPSEAEVRALTSRVKANEGSLSSWVPISGLTTVTGSYFTRTTGVITAGAGFQYVVVPVQPGDRIRVDQSRLFGTGIALASYHTSSVGMGSGTYISREYDGSATDITFGTTNSAYELTIPSNCRAIGISGRDNVPFIITKLTLQSTLAQRVAAIESGASTSAFANMTGAWFGDSITGQGRWQTQVIAALALGTSTNCGVGGTTVSKPDVNSSTAVSMCDDARINAIPSGSKLITFMGGTNDMGQSRPLGAITPVGATSFDNTTFYGGLETVATKLLTRFNTGQMIVWMTAPLGQWDARTVGGTPWPDPWTNLVNLRIEDYNAALKAVAAKYGFPCVDLRQLLGWNSLNISQYLDAESNLLHPSAAVGGPRISAILIDFLRSNLSRTAALINV